MSDTKRLAILDMHAILHRAYHAIPELSSSKGEPTGALYGLVSILVRLISDLGPDYVVAAYDLPGPTHRHLAFEKYKAHRAETDDALVAQIVRSRDVLDALGIPRYEAPGFEADDVIGTIVEKTKKNRDLDVVICSGDLDMMQLLDDGRVRVYRMRKGITDLVLYDEDSFVKEFGFPSKLLPDYKGLRGDPSDNIPGVVGIGEKTASVLIQNFGSVEDLYKTLKKDHNAFTQAGIKDGILRKLEEQEENARSSKALAEIHREAPIDFSVPKEDWRARADREKVFTMLAEFEFRSLVPRMKALLGDGPAARAAEQKEGDTNGMFAEELPAPQEEIDKIALAVWVLDSNITEPALEDIYRVGKSKNFAEAKTHILAAIEKEGLSYVYENIELPLSPILRQMERRGVRIDTDFLKKLSKEYRKELEEIEKRIFETAGGEFNVNSPKQLGEVLFDKLGLVAKKKTAGGARSTRESELQKLKGEHPIVADILAYRELSKLLSTYIDAIPKLVDEEGRLHTSYVQAGPTTGRLSSVNPNLQNIPIKSDLGRAIRHGFVPSEGMQLLSFDYSQIELRVGAILSGDPGLIEIFKDGRDVHTEVAARVFHVEGRDVSYEQRRRAKVINFGILYGMGVNALKEALGTSRAEAQEFYDQYFAAFPRLAAYLEETKQDAARMGYTATLFGRRRYFDGIKSPIPYVRAAAERMAINAPMQGTAADIVKLAMVGVDKLCEEEGLSDDLHMLLQVHDELVFEVSEKKIQSIAPKIKEVMEGVLPEKERKGVPLKVEGKSGPNWGDMESL